MKWNLSCHFICTFNPFNKGHLQWKDTQVVINILLFCNTVFSLPLTEHNWIERMTDTCVQSASEEVVDFLQKLCSNDIDVDIGTIVHTGMQNKYGGFENDTTIARLDHNQWVSSFLLLLVVYSWTSIPYLLHLDSWAAIPKYMYTGGCERSFACMAI